MVFIIYTTPIWGRGSMKLNPRNLEVDGEILGEAVTEEEMDGKRGAFMGFYFSVLFEGYWDTLGNYQANLLTNTNANSTAPPSLTSSLTSSLPPGTQVNIQATVSGIGNTQGIFQITQVPGSGNIVTSNLIINIQVIQTLGNTISNLPRIWK
jgi:hypothetical protein